MSSNANPYAPPVARVADVSNAADSQSEAIRQEHIKHEASVRSVGLLYLLGGLLASIAAIGMLAAAFFSERSGLLLGLSAIYLAIGALSLFAGKGLRDLQPWARTTSIVLSSIGLLGFPVGTLINGYILYLMLSAKGKRIFSEDYADIIAATPHIKYKTSIIVWIVLGILIAAIAAAILLPQLTR
jgi:hypothetical protein